MKNQKRIGTRAARSLMDFGDKFDFKSRSLSRPSFLKAIVLGSLCAATLFTLGCTSAKFSAANADATVTPGTGTASGTGGTTSGTGSGTGTTSTAPVCEPFGGTSSTSPTQGLVTNGVYYIETNNLASGQDPMTVINNTVEGFFVPNAANIGFIAQKIFLSAINFEDMYFTQGFTDSTGATLKNSAGTALTSYFGFRATGTFVTANWTPGDYQIAILTDDGAILTIHEGQASGADFTITNDGAHSMQMGCTTSVLHVTSTTSLPIQFDYFQGPPVTIGLMMMYRPITTAVGNVQDPLCGAGGNSDSYFFLDHDANNNPISPPQAQAPYNQLVGAYNAQAGTGGWKVVEAAHFVLPTGTTNSCVQ